MPFVIRVANLTDLFRLTPHSVELKVNKLTSPSRKLPMDYYELPFCAPPEGRPEIEKDLPVGDRIESSPYRLAMKTDMYCEQLCIIN